MQSNLFWSHVLFFCQKGIKQVEILHPSSEKGEFVYQLFLSIVFANICMIEICIFT